MEDERAKVQKEIKFLREMQLELRPKNTKKMFSKENVQNVGTSNNGSCSIEEVIKNSSVSKDYLKQIGDLKEDSFSIVVIHETSELSVYIDRRDHTELISDIYMAFVSPRIFNEIFTNTSSYEKETIGHIRQLWAQSFLQIVKNQKVEEQNLQDQMQMVEEDKDIEKDQMQMVEEDKDKNFGKTKAKEEESLYRKKMT
ncbi:unnamed protein product [Vicia faba]|uniref:Uncharacterized protein n=1 Tax=Vicia faba TaxID=3906 RepID=A0AAV0ZSV3_VICFA|nr:unnamed protein product [Vicia faba]